MAMANAVQKLADKTPGKEARAMEAFAHALRQVRRCFSLVSCIFNQDALK